MVNRARREPRGVALVFVLWLLVLLGVAASEIALRARNESNLVSTLRSRSVGRYAAESGILLATARIEGLLDSLRAPAERAAAFRHESLRSPIAEIALGDARFGVAIIDLNARLDLNRADATTLRNLFRQFVPESRAADVVRALKQDPVRRVEELARVPNAGDSLALAVAPYVTVWSDGLVNLNSASERVLAALPGVGRAAAANIVRQRESGEVLTSPEGVRSRGADGPLLTVLPTRLMLVCRGWQAGHPLTHEIDAVYVVLGQSLVLQSWEERDR
jgi:general secretion pathway protein K